MIQNLGDRIQTLRKEAKLSQEALAEQVGVSRQAISKWERNEATPDVYNLSSLSQIFSVTMDELINKEGETTVNKVKLIRLDLKKQSEIMIIGAVIGYIIATFSFLVLPFSEVMNLFIVGVMIAAATGVVIYAGFMNERFRMLNNIDKNDKYDKDNNQLPISYKARKDALTSVVSMSVTVIYLYLGFIKGLWHPGWLVFLLVPIATSLYDVIFGGRITEDKEEDK